MTDGKNLRFKIETARRRFTCGFAVHDMKAHGRCLAYIAEIDDALAFLELKGRQSDPKNWRKGLYDPNHHLGRKLKNEGVQKVLNSLFTTFRSFLPDDDGEAKSLLEDHTYTGKDDPGGWSPEALAVVHIESTGIPGNEEIVWIELWAAASEMLGDAYFEQINGGVVAVYPC